MEGTCNGSLKRDQYCSLRLIYESVVIILPKERRARLRDRATSYAARCLSFPLFLLFIPVRPLLVVLRRRRKHFFFFLLCGKACD